MRIAAGWQWCVQMHFAQPCVLLPSQRVEWLLAWRLMVRMRMMMNAAVREGAELELSQDGPDDEPLRSAPTHSMQTAITLRAHQHSSE